MDIQIDLVTFVISLMAVVCVCMYTMEVVHARRVEKLKNLCDELSNVRKNV